MNKTLEELDRENWELLRAMQYFRDSYTKVKEENKQLRIQLQELQGVLNDRK